MYMWMCGCFCCLDHSLSLSLSLSPSLPPSLSPSLPLSLPLPPPPPLSLSLQDSKKLQFSHIAALHSEILLVSRCSRQLYSWPCREGDSTPRPHPLSKELGLDSESISLLESSDCRATVVTYSGKVATFYDSLLRGEGREGESALACMGWTGESGGRCWGKEAVGRGETKGEAGCLHVHVHVHVQSYTCILYMYSVHVHVQCTCTCRCTLSQRDKAA